MPTNARAYLLLVEFAALLITSALLLTESVSAVQWVRLAVLAVLALGYAEAGARIERLKRYLSPSGDKVVSNQVSVWAFAAVLTAPAGWTAVLIAVLYVQYLVRRCRDKTGVSYRVVFAGATVMLSAEASSAVLRAAGDNEVLSGHLRGSGAVVAALLVFTMVNFAVLLTGMWLSQGRPRIRSMLPDSDAFGHEIATLALGIVTAEFLVHSPALTPVALILAGYLQRSSLVNSLHRAARTDTKTGLPNLAAWTEQAQSALSRSHRHHKPVTVLFCDLDEFKAVNDLHGHLMGDEVLAAVAKCLRRELRGHEAVGRFGGDEFVVILDSLDHGEAEMIASRLRTAVSALRFDGGVHITASVGLAHQQPGQQPPDLNELLSRADSALLTAKAGGRNRVKDASESVPVRYATNRAAGPAGQLPLG